MAFLLKDYTDIKEIARGGMGKVYLATQISLNRKVIIKEMATGLLTNAAEIKRFENEARAAAALDHDNIIRIYDFGEDRGSFYISMEYIDGPNLDTIVKDRHYLPEIGLMILLYALKGLSHAHAHRIIHRDIKPGNIIVSRAGAVKVVDFGLAHAGSQQLNLTASDVIVGTPLFMSPEQATGEEKKDPRMDVWSVGVLLYRIVTGNYPFVGDNVPAILFNIVQTPEQKVHELYPALPRDLTDNINACLVKDRSKRLSNLYPLITSLQNYFFELGIKDTAEEIRRYVSDAPASSRALSQRLHEHHLQKAEAYKVQGNEALSQAHAQHAKRYDPLYRPIVKAMDAIKKHTSSSITKRPASSVISGSWQAPPRKKNTWPLIALPIALALALGIGAGSYRYFHARDVTQQQKTVSPESSDRKTLAVASASDSISPITQTSDTNSGSGAYAKSGPTIATSAHPVVKKKADPKLLAATRPGTRDDLRKSALQKNRSQQSQSGIVRIVVTPADAEVRIDGEKIAEPELSEGKRCIAGLHQIDASANSFEPFSRAVTVEKDAVQIVTIDLVPEKPGMSSVHIHTYPWAEIYVNGEFKGNTPTAKPLALLEGTHVIELKRAGYKTHEERFLLKKGELKKIKVRLTKE